MFNIDRFTFTTDSFPGIYKIINRNSGTAIDMPGSSKGTQAQIWTWGQTANQRWTVQFSGSYFYMMNNYSSLVLGVLSASLNPGAKIVQWSHNTSSDQQWELVPTGDGYYYIQDVNSGCVIDCQGGATADGTQLIQWPNDGANSQQWSLQDAANN